MKPTRLEVLGKVKVNSFDVANFQCSKATNPCKPNQLLLAAWCVDFCRATATPNMTMPHHASPNFTAEGLPATPKKHSVSYNCDYNQETIRKQTLNYMYLAGCVSKSWAESQN